jgi:hypothetical protein
MNHFLKNQDAHRRLARGANAGVVIRGFGRRYQAGAEFKARQLWLDFQDAVGTALEAISASMDAGRAWFKKWVRNFRTESRDQASDVYQFPLVFCVAWTTIRHRRAA